MNLINFKKDKSFHTKIEIVSNRILEMILNGTLKPRDRIQINTVAEALGFSVIPVREAIRELEARGFLEIKPHRGVHVREPDMSELADIFEVRILLECRAGRLAVETIKNSDIIKLRSVHAKCEKVLEQSDHSSLVKYYSLCREFDKMLYKVSGNAALCKAIENIAMTTQPYLFKYISSSKSRKVAFQEHGWILKAYEERDAQRVENAIAKHLKNILSTIVKLTDSALKSDCMSARRLGIKEFKTLGADSQETGIAETS